MGGYNMAFCSNCGTELSAQQDVCLKCGVYVSNGLRKNGELKNTKANIGWGILGFFFPIVGFILYLVWKENDPLNSAISGKGALFGFIFGFVFGILLSI
jgi:hypothetical protein